MKADIKQMQSALQFLNLSKVSASTARPKASELSGALRQKVRNHFPSAKFNFEESFMSVYNQSALTTLMANFPVDDWDAVSKYALIHFNTKKEESQKKGKNPTANNVKTDRSPTENSGQENQVLPNQLLN